MLASTITHQLSTWSFDIENANEDGAVDDDLTPLPSSEGISPFFVSSDDKLDGLSPRSSVAGITTSTGLPFGFAQELDSQSNLPQNYSPWSSSWRSFHQANLIRRASAVSLDSDQGRTGSTSSSCNGERRESYYQGSVGTNDDGWDDFYEDPEYSYGPPPSSPLPPLPMIDNFSALSLAIERDFASSCFDCSSKEAGDHYENEEDSYEYDHDHSHDGRTKRLTIQHAYDPPYEYAFRPYSDSFSSETSQSSFSRFEIDYAQFSQTVPTTMATVSDQTLPKPLQDDLIQGYEDDDDDGDDEEEEEKDVQTPGLICAIGYSHQDNQQPNCFFDSQSRKTGLSGVWKEGSINGNLRRPEIEVVAEI